MTNEAQVKPHVHSEMIKIWADNMDTVFQFNFQNESAEWQDVVNPIWTKQ